MNKSNISEKDQKKLFKALDRMRVAQDEQKKKKFEKLFKKFGNEPSLEEALNSLTVAELKEIKKVWSVEVASTAKKGELVEKIAKSMESDILKGMECFDNDRVKALNELIGIEVKEELFSGMNSVIYFRKIGLIFPAVIDGKKILVCPLEIKKQLEKLQSEKSFKELIKRNDDVLNLTRGYLHVYGVLGISRCMELIEGKAGIPVQYDWFIQLILQRYSFAGEEYTICGDNICHIDVFDHMDILQKVSEADHSYREFPIDKIKEYGQCKFGEDSENRRGMKDLLLKAYKMDENDSEEIVAACEYAIRNDKELQFVMDYLGHNLVINDMDIYSKILKSLVDLQEETIHWALKGYTPAGLKKVQSGVSKEKVGRNDPCPCGSGKKFKKCCGKN